jgi:hypothetical protein
MNQIQEQQERAHVEREALRGGYDPAMGSLSDEIMPDSAACNARREALRAILSDVGLERALIILIAVHDEQVERERLDRELDERDRQIDEQWMREGSR